MCVASKLFCSPETSRTMISMFDLVKDVWALDIGFFWVEVGV